MRPLRVALCADFPEERWPSMDRVADRLCTYLRRDHGQQIEVTPVVPRFVRRATWLSRRESGRAYLLDRIVNRLWDYPRHVQPLADQFDVFHVIDHSYSQLVHHLPAGQTVVTCHDLDTFRSLLRPEEEPRSRPYNAMMRHVLAGLRQAARITCDTEAVRTELVAQRLAEPDRVTVAPVAVGPEFSHRPDRDADDVAARLVGAPADVPVLLHVGSTISRKRIDVLLDTFAGLSGRAPDMRLVRVGGRLTGDQATRARALGVADRIITPEFLDDRVLAAIYRRATLVLLPSEREGFGLPLVEAMACGTPVVASDLEVLREVGGSCVEYCPVGAVSLWRQRVLELLAEWQHAPARRAARVEAGLGRAVRFSWPHFAALIADVYRETARRPVRGLVRVSA